MCPIKTHVTNLFVSVISRTGNSFGLSRSVVKPILTHKTIQIQMVQKQNKDKCVLLLVLALPPLPSSCSLPSSSTSSSPLLHCLPLLQLDAPHGDHPHHWVLVELALAVHQTVCLRPLDSDPLVYLPCHGRME